MTEKPGTTEDGGTDPAHGQLSPVPRNHERLEAGVRILTSFAIGSLRGAKSQLDKADSRDTREKP